MTHKRLSQVLALLAVALLVLGGCVPLPAEPPVSRVVSSAGIDTPTNATWYNGPTITVYSDDHATSKFSVAGSSGNVTVAGTLGVTGASTLTGATSVTGALAANGGFSVDTPAFTVADTTGNTVISGTLTVSGTTTLVGATTVGGGYGDTGVSLSAAGVGQFNGALTTDGALTADSAVIGGGYGSTGCTVSAAGVLQCNGAMTTDGGFTTALLTLTKGGAVAVTQDGIITPTNSFQELTAAGAVSTGSIYVYGAGTVLWLWNSSANTITISDTGTLKLSGDIALAQDDTLTLISDGTNWIQTATSNN